MHEREKRINRNSEKRKHPERKNEYVKICNIHHQQDTTSTQQHIFVVVVVVATISNCVDITSSQTIVGERKRKLPIIERTAKYRTEFLKFN